jgi:hypothetical protein
MSPLEVVRRQRRKEARPAELAAAALSLFIEKGFAATRLDEVAARPASPRARSTSTSTARMRFSRL